MWHPLTIVGPTTTELFSYYFIIAGPVAVEGKVCGRKVLPQPFNVLLLNDFPSAFCAPMAVSLLCSSHNQSNHGWFVLIQTVQDLQVSASILHRENRGSWSHSGVILESRHGDMGNIGTGLSQVGTLSAVEMPQGHRPGSGCRL